MNAQTTRLTHETPTFNQALPPFWHSLVGDPEAEAPKTPEPPTSTALVGSLWIQLR